MRNTGLPAYRWIAQQSCYLSIGILRLQETKGLDIVLQHRGCCIPAALGPHELQTDAKSQCRAPQPEVLIRVTQACLGVRRHGGHAMKCTGTMGLHRRVH